MRWFLVALLVIHGLIHGLGFVKAFDLAAVPQLVQPISRPVGALWLVAGLLCLVTAAALAAGAGWVVVPLGLTVALSQALVSLSFRDAFAGTLPNLVLGLAAILLALSPQFAATALIAIAVLKITAASVSLGSGFRGGLFFASLMVGALIGRCYGDFTSWIDFGTHAQPVTMAVVGMTALGTGIVGAPMSMTFLALEMTGDFGIALAAFVASLIVTIVVRETFGYSFATWRFHLRGETIRGPHDVGWMRDLSVVRMMRKDVRTLLAATTIADARALAPLGAAKEVALVDEQDRYCGLVLVGDIHAAAFDPAEPISKLAHYQTAFLTPRANIRDALDMFAANEADVLAVVTDDARRKVVGSLSEAHALRRYGEELEKRNRAYIDR